MKLKLVEKVGTELTAREMDKLKGKPFVTSLELVDMINAFRKAEGRSTELRHDTMLRTIRDEFEEEIAFHKIVECSYINENNRKMPMFELTPKQGMQVLLRESKFVRRAILDYLERLEETNRILMMRAKDKDVFKKHMITFDESMEYTPSRFEYGKLNKMINKATSKVVGSDVELTKANMNEEQLEVRQSISDDTTTLMRYIGKDAIKVVKEKFNID